MSESGVLYRPARAWIEGALEWIRTGVRRRDPDLDIHRCQRCSGTAHRIQVQLHNAWLLDQQSRDGEK